MEERKTPNKKLFLSEELKMRDENTNLVFETNDYNLFNMNRRSNRDSDILSNY